MNGQASIIKIGDKILQSLESKPKDNLGKSIEAPPFCIVGASARGRLHYHNDTPRDDAFVTVFNGIWLAVAVADGAGSKTLSRYGASLLANKLCSRLLRATKQQAVELAVADIQSDTNEQHYLENIVLKAFRQTRGDLERFAKKKGKNLEDFHSTLLGLILNTKTMEMGIGQIGDGLILGLDESGKAVMLADPPTTDDPAASYFITQEDWEQYLYIKEMDGEEVSHFSTLYLMTDGVANDCQYGPPANILEMWAKDMGREIRLVSSLEATAERLKNYLASYKAKGSFDDRTLVVIFKDKVQ